MRSFLKCSWNNMCSWIVYESWSRIFQGLFMPNEPIVQVSFINYSRVNQCIVQKSWTVHETWSRMFRWHFMSNVHKRFKIDSWTDQESNNLSYKVHWNLMKWLWSQNEAVLEMFLKYEIMNRPWNLIKNFSGPSCQNCLKLIHCLFRNLEKMNGSYFEHEVKVRQCIWKQKKLMNSSWSFLLMNNSETIHKYLFWNNS